MSLKTILYTVLIILAVLFVIGIIENIRQYLSLSPEEKRQRREERKREREEQRQIEREKRKLEREERKREREEQRQIEREEKKQERKRQREIQRQIYEQQRNAIATAVQKSTYVNVYNAIGEMLFSKDGNLIGFTSSTVTIRKGNFVNVYDVEGKLIQWHSI